MPTKTRIPFLDLAAQHAPLADALNAVFARAVVSSGFIGGDELARFELEFASAVQTVGCVGVANGTDALVLALRALGIGPGDVVVVPAVTFIATAAAVMLVGATPRFVDIDPHSRTLCTSALEALNPKNVRAVIAVHLYGRVAPLNEIQRIANHYGWYVIEDAAQAHGAVQDGQAVGGIGDVGTFSFYPGKNLGALGDGGAVVSQDARLLDHVRCIANHGRTTQTEHMHIGCNSRLDAIQAGCLRVKLPYLAQWNAARKRVAHWYDVALKGLQGIGLPAEAPVGEHVYHAYVITYEHRDALVAYLREAGVSVAVHYPTIVPEQPAFARLAMHGSAFDHARMLTSKCVSLPIFPTMTQTQVERVSDAIRAFVRRDG